MKQTLGLAAVAIARYAMTLLVAIFVLIGMGIGAHFVWHVMSFGWRLV